VKNDQPTDPAPAGAIVTPEQIEEAQRIIKANLKAEYEAHHAVVKQAKALEDIVDLALAALQDHQPALSAMLMRKAKAVFKGETNA
jgi:hypothetical protein